MTGASDDRVPISDILQGTPIKLVLTEGGYLFRNGSLSAGPFSEIEIRESRDLDARVAQQLNVPEKEIYVARLKAPNSRLEFLSDHDIHTKFVAEAGQGPDVPTSGFIMFDGDEWIAAEATYLYGKLTEVQNPDTKSERIETTEALQRVFFYSHLGKRDKKLSDDAVFQLGTKFLRPTSKTLGGSGPPTLMSLETAQRFLTGETVTIKDLFDSVISGLKQFVNLDWDPRLYDVVGCIITSSYFFDLFGAYPIIVILGPFETGKTRLLLSICYMGHRGMPILDPSEASIFRTAEAWRALLTIDEFYEIGPAIERLLRASYKKGMRVPRIDKSKGGQMLLALFEIFGKIAIATPETPPPNIVSKSIMLKLLKMPDPSQKKRDPEPRDFENIRAKGYIARLTLAPEVRANGDYLDTDDHGLVGREYEVWKPSLTVAKIIGGSTWTNVHGFATEQSKEKRQESYAELHEILESLLEVVREFLKTAQIELPTKDNIQNDTKVLASFTPKQVHDVTWERMKDQYRVTREKQEVRDDSGEEHLRESYDYDTRSFEKQYSVQRVGQTYLRQLGLKRLKHGKKGSLYGIRTGQEFHELVVRYHPALQGDLNEDGTKSSERATYETLLGLVTDNTTQREAVIPKKGVTGVTGVTTPDFERENQPEKSDTLNSVTPRVSPEPLDSVTPDTLGKTPPEGVTEKNPRIEREKTTGDTRSTWSSYFRDPPGSTDRDRCSRCGLEDIPLRADPRERAWPVCRKCFEEMR